MSREEFAKAYQEGFARTVRFLVSKGVPPDDASETAQGAWAKGWEKLEQLRSPDMVFTWMNSIALNLYRSTRRREDPLPLAEDMAGSHGVDWKGIEARRILRLCKNTDRSVLQSYYLEGNLVREMAQRQGCSDLAMRIRLLRARRNALLNLQGARRAA